MLQSMEPPSRVRRMAGVLLATCIVVAVAHTWPMVTAPHRLSRIDNADYQLNAWAISWVAHQLITDPLHLFDANIFWPDRGTLAFSEAMIVQGLIAAPVRWLGGNPILAFNVAMFSGYVLTAFAFGLLARRWTGSWTAAFVAASAAGFNAHLFTRMAHLQAMHVEFFPLVLYGLDQVFTRSRIRDAITLGVAFALQALTSIYLMVFMTWALIFGGLTRLVIAGRGKRGRPVLLAVLAGGVALLLLAFYLNGYYQVHVEQGFARVAASQYVGSSADYLSTVSWVHYPLWSHRFFPESAATNFPGITVLLLAGVAVSSRATRRDPRVLMCAAVAAGCALVSMAPRLPGYEHIHKLVPLFWALRAPARLGQVVLLALAVLAGFGIAQLERRWSQWRGWPALAVAAVALINAEAFRAPLPYRPFDGIPKVYNRMIFEESAIVAEFPLWEPRQTFANGRYMLNSTVHWKPLVNGYSGFVPASYFSLYEDVKNFPAPSALDALRRRGITHVIVHDAALADSARATGAFEQIANEAGIAIFRWR
jgi:hypothetical protein